MSSARLPQRYWLVLPDWSAHFEHRAGGLRLRTDFVTRPPGRQAQATNDLDEALYSHGVFERDPAVPER